MFAKINFNKNKGYYTNYKIKKVYQFIEFWSFIKCKRDFSKKVRLFSPIRIPHSIAIQWRSYPKAIQTLQWSEEQCIQWWADEHTCNDYYKRQLVSIEMEFEQISTNCCIFHSYRTVIIHRSLLDRTCRQCWNGNWKRRSRTLYKDGCDSKSVCEATSVVGQLFTKEMKLIECGGLANQCNRTVSFLLWF